MESISIKIQRGDYVNRIVRCLNDVENEKGRLEQLFKCDLFTELHITNHPMAEKLYDIVWQRTHHLGRQEMVDFAYELVNLLEG